MKKPIIFSIALMIISIASASAQKFQLGVKGGVNFFNVQDQGGTYSQALNNQFQFGYNLGGFAILNLSKHVGIQPEVMWNEYQTRTSDNANAIYDSLWPGKNISLNYLTVPLLLNISPSKIITFQVGPQFGILINESQTFYNNTKNAFKKGDFSMVGGVQLNLAWIKLGARYVVGLNNISDLPNSNAWKNHGAQAYVGIKII
ncbi:MAG: PorT family protein [Bacteroidetes bacterium]|nr:PorT family protein [Bacteroidota bacterium]MBS1974649.1 PorT family protein [Bacteroidota bacterium]